MDSGERPINVDASNVVWVDPPRLGANADGPKLAYLWGSLEDGEANGTFVRLPAGFRGAIHSHDEVFRAVVIKGELRYGEAEVEVLEPGSYFGSSEETVHELSSGEEGCVLYVRTVGRYEVGVKLN